jgi:2-amino-4-hydroxy-6-hydroxymethyldihydropteridine diphosphokinase
MINNIYIALGSNIEPRESYINLAIEEIGSFTSLVKISSVIESKPVGFESDVDFLNAVIQISCELTPRELLLKLQEIEKKLGRDKKSTFDSRGKQIYSSRIIDLDILFYGNQVLISPRLTIPHPEIYNRDFVLFPLKEIAGDYIDPLRMTCI